MKTKLTDVQNLLSDLISRYSSRVDYLMIRLEEAEGTDIVLRGDKVETLSEGISIGGHVRTCYKGGWGLSSFNKLTTIEDRIEEAIAAARIVGDEETILAAIDPVQAVCRLPLLGTDPRQVSLKQKKQLCDRYTDLLKTVDHRITTTSVHYSDSTQRVIIVTSEGTFIDQSWVDMEMRFAATARNGETVQTGRETTGSRKAYEDLTNLDKQVKGAAERAVTSLFLPSVKGNTYTVVIDPILSGLFVHEAFGHLSEADMAYENPDVLVGRLHSRETAGKLEEKPTGNARCLNYHYSPIVRMTNTWIERGKTPVADLFTGIKEGVFAQNWLGGMTNGEMFTFSAGEAWMIRNGKIAEPVKDVTLSGNVFQTLADIEAIGDDFYWDESGGCGKGGQNGLPVGCGGPSLRIRDVVVGGESGE